MRFAGCRPRGEFNKTFAALHVRKPDAGLQNSKRQADTSLFGSERLARSTHRCPDTFRRVGFEFLERALVAPVTLRIIFLMLYLNYGDTSTQL